MNTHVLAILILLAFNLTTFSVRQAKAQNASQDSAEGSHQKMIVELAQIAKQAAVDNPYFGTASTDRLARMISHAPKDLPAEQLCNALVQLGTNELRLGREQDAIKHWMSAARIISKAPERAPQQIKEYASFFLAVGFMRLGETQNCCVRNNEDSCVYPVQGAGIHTNQEGSRAAIKMLEQLLKNSRNPEMVGQAKWLLNIAYQTVGEYPDGVPAEYLIRADAIDSGKPIKRFRNIAKQLGLDTFSTSGGVVADDFDGDHRIDLLVSTYDPAGQIKFFRNTEAGKFEDRTQQANLLGITGGLNMVQADYNNDNHVDVCITRGGWWKQNGRHPNSLLRNNGDGTFTDVTFMAGLASPKLPTQTASWADYDLDGDVDLFVGNESMNDRDQLVACQLFRNNGDGTFTDVAEAARVTNNAFPKAVIWGDFDNDRWPDLYVSNFEGHNRLYRNNGDGTFTDEAKRLGVTEPIASFPAWFWDVDNDGRLELFVGAYGTKINDLTNSLQKKKFKAELPRLYRWQNDGFVDVAASMGLIHPSAPMGSNFGDLDNDGYLDFYLGTGWPDYKSLMPNMMYRNRAGEQFSNVTVSGGFGNLQKGHAIAFADFDKDGDQDIFQQMGGAFPGDKYFDAYYENPGFGNQWLNVRLVGRKSNRSGIGSKITVTIAEASERKICRWVNSGGSFGASPLRQHFGLGSGNGEISVEVYWPKTGLSQTYEEVPRNTSIEIVEGAREIIKLD